MVFIGVGLRSQGFGGDVGLECSYSTSFESTYPEANFVAVALYF